jgi:hypothetical protein
MVTPLIPCHVLLCFTSSYICRNNAILWYPPDSPAYSDALLMKALCSHCLIPQLCCAIEPGVSLLGGRIICGLDVPIEEHVAAFICALDRFESAWLSEESGSCAVSSACRDAFCIGGGDEMTLPEVKRKLEAGEYASLKSFITDIHVMVS